MELLAAMIGRSDPHGDRAQAFHGRNSTVFGGEDVWIRQSEFLPGERLAVHEHTSSYLCLVLDGVFTEGVSGVADIQAAPGSVYFLPAGRGHSNAFGPLGARCLRVEIGETTRANLAEGLSDLTHPVAVAGGPASWSALRLYRCASSRAAGPLDVEERLVETLNHLDPRPRHHRGLTPRWVRGVRTRLLDALDESPTLRGLADEAGVHAVHLARTFRHHYGCSIGECLHAMRVTRACQLLARTSRPLADIAGAVGYYDQSHFTHMFKARTGVTPAMFRTLMQPGRRDVGSSAPRP